MWAAAATLVGKRSLTSAFRSTHAFAAGRPSFSRPVNGVSEWHSLLPATGWQRRASWLSASADDDGNEPESSSGFEPTWTYVPHDPKKKSLRRPAQPGGPRRTFSSKVTGKPWNVPKTVHVPLEHPSIDLQFVRSSGAGGQNVNKVNTKVELKLNVGNAHWIPYEVRQRLRELPSVKNRINQNDELLLTSQEYRTQGQNKKAVVEKLQRHLLQAWPRPKVRKERKGISKAAKERNKEFKKRRGQTKANRRKVTDW